MPELPEVETVVRGLEKNIKSQKITAVSVTYSGIIYPAKTDLVKLLTGDSFVEFDRHGKYMLLTTQKGTRLIVHLRMTGQFFITDNTYQPDKHVHLILEMSNGAKLIYRDIRKFGRWIVVDKKKQFADYINAGVDALVITKDQLAEQMQRFAHKKLKAFLLDQVALAGVGNIYADEICYELKVDPEIEVSKVKVEPLWTALKAILKLAIKHKGTSVSDYLTSAGARGNFQNLLSVYKQKKCKKCGAEIKRKKVAGRTSHYCAECQKK